MPPSSEPATAFAEVPVVLWFVCVDMTLLVDGDARGESQLGEEDGCGRDHDEGDEAGGAGNARRRRGRRRRCRWRRPRPAVSRRRWWPGRRCRSSRRSRGRSCSARRACPVSSSRGAGHDRHGDGHEDDAEPECRRPACREAGRSGSCRRCRRSESRSIPAAAMAKPAAIGTRTPAWVISGCRRGRRRRARRRAGGRRGRSASGTRSEDVLHVERDEQEQAEERGRGREHHQRSPPPTPRSARRWMRSSGCVVWSSAMTKRQTARPAPREAEDLRRSVQPASAACESANTSAPRPVGGEQRRRGRSSPLQPRRGGVGGNDPVGGDGDGEPDGDIDQEDRLPADELVRAPPTSTPIAAPAPPTAPQAASACARWCPSRKVLMRIDSAAGESIAAPRP